MSFFSLKWICAFHLTRIKIQSLTFKRLYDLTKCHKGHHYFFLSIPSIIASLFSSNIESTLYPSDLWPLELIPPSSWSTLLKRWLAHSIISSRSQPKCHLIRESSLTIWYESTFSTTVPAISLNYFVIWCFYS